MKAIAEIPVNPPREDDHHDTRPDATALPVGSRVNGVLEVDGDTDVFRVDVAQAGTLTVYTRGDTNTEGTLQGSDGTALTADDDSGTGDNFQIVHRVTPGTYYAFVMGHEGDSGRHTGHYTVAASLEVAPSPSGGVGSDQVGDEFGTTSTTGRTNLDLTCTNPVIFSNSGSVVLPSVDIVALPPAAGTVTLEYDAYGIPDRFVVAVGGRSVIDTQYVGTRNSVPEVNAVLARYGFTPTSQAAIISPGSGSRSFQKLAGVTTSVVRVYAPLTGTAWEVTLRFSGASCPQQPGGGA